MLKIGLTGGIGSGKSTVTRLFAELGVPIIDTDEIARAVVAPHTVGWHAIIDHFGTSIINPTTQELNRRQLRELIFTNLQEKKWLEQLLHPLIREQVQQQTAALTADYCITVIPLLFESAYDYDLDRIVVVDSYPLQQQARVIARDHANAAQVSQIMAQQISREQRLAQADDVIDNTQENLEYLREQILRLHQFYLHLAKQPPPM